MTTSITLRSTKGSALTHDEMDTNLTNLQTTADDALAATDTLTADKAEAAALGVANTDQNMGSFTGTTISDNVSAKAAIQALETAVETKANASAVGVTASAANMGTYTGTTIPDNETAKQNLQSLETAVETKANASALGVTSSAANMGTFAGSIIPDSQTAKQALQVLENNARMLTHLPFAPDFTNNTITVRDGSSDTYHRHFGGIAQGMDGRLHLFYRRAAEHAVTSGETIYYTYSDDGGQSWSAEAALVAGVAGFDQRGVSVCVTPTGRIVAIYDQTPAPAVGAGSTTFRLVYSDDNGATWTQGTDILTVPYDYARSYGRIKLIGSHFSNNYQLAWTPYYQVSASPTYKLAVWYSSDDGLTWTEGTAIQDEVNGNNEAEMVYINDQTWFAVARGTGLNLYKTTDGGTTWSDTGKITTSDGVAPSLDKFCHNGRWYLLVGYCDRSLDTQAFKIAPVDEALSSPNAFGAPLVVATDAVNASGYQTTVTKPDGTVYVDGGTGFVWFKEYIGFDYSQVRFGRVDLFELAHESGRGVAVASGAFTVYDTEFEPKLIVSTESGSTDDLDTINGGYEGQVIYCESASSSSDVTFKHLTGNIVLTNGRDFTLFTAGATGSRITLKKMGTRWYEQARSVDSTNGFYETGTWTPVPRGSGTAGSPTGTFAGSYVKIGKFVSGTGQIVFTGLDTMAGNVEIAGLPYSTPAGASNRGSISVGFRSNFTNDFPVGAYIVENSTFMRLQRMDLDATSVAVGDLSATTNLYFTFSYIAAV